MKDNIVKNATSQSHLDFVGDNLAINFINTRRMFEGQLTDTLQSDSDVKAWLKRLGVPSRKERFLSTMGCYFKVQESFARSR